MADRFYGCEFGTNGPGNVPSVTEGVASTAGLDVEVRVTYDATNNSKLATLLALEAITAAIAQDTWPPV